MKIAVIIVRVLIGLLFIFSAIAYFAFSTPPPDDLSENTKMFLAGLEASKYIMPVTKIFELLCGLAFLSGRFVALAVVLIFPIVFNILMINAIHFPSGLPIAIPLFIGILFLAFACRKNYETLLAVK